MKLSSALFGLSLIAVSTLPITATAAAIGPWPVDGTQMWEDQPIPGYNGGAISISGTPAPFGLLNTPVSTAVPKNASWLPYLTYPTGTPSSYTGERMTTAGLILDPGASLATVHARVYDPGTANKHGWAVILKDNSGNILDFGIRGFFASQQIIAHQFDVDTTSWTFPSSMTRTRTGNNYYSLDFSINLDGTINWAIDANENGSTWNNSGATTVTFGSISEVYLNVMTPDNNGNGTSYRWTEFGYTLVPEPSTSMLLLGALLTWAYTRRNFLRSSR